MPTFSKRATLIRDTERLLKLIILYNDDDDSDDVENNENMVLFYTCSIKKKEKVDDISTNPQVDTIYVVATPDNQILEGSKMLKEPDKLFSMLQYLLADAGYALGLYVCTQHR